MDIKWLIVDLVGQSV